MQHLKESSSVSNKQDEVEVVVLFKYIKKFFYSIGRGFRFLFNAIFSNLVMILIFASVGAAIGYSIYRTTKPFYTSTMTLMLADIRNEFVEDQLNKLSEMVREDNFEAISDHMDISLDAAKTIKNMKFSNLDEDRIEEDSILMGSPFKVELTLYDNKQFTSMEPAIANYLENNRYFSKLKRIKQREAESIIKKLKSDISSIDSIKSTVISPRGPVNGFVYGEPIDPTNLYRESFSMYKQQVVMEANLDQLDNIEVVNGFSPRSKPTGPNLLKQTLFWAFLFFIMGVIVSLIIHVRKFKELVTKV